MNRQRVQHRDYGWLGEIDYDNSHHLPTGWRTVRWDNGTTTTEHADDLAIREGAK